jgi:hypothetical protein
MSCAIVSYDSTGTGSMLPLGEGVCGRQEGDVVDGAGHLHTSTGVQLCLQCTLLETRRNVHGVLFHEASPSQGCGYKDRATATLRTRRAQLTTL